MNNEVTSKLAKCIWQARFGTRSVDNETSLEIWLCAENFLSSNEGSLLDGRFDVTGNTLSEGNDTYDLGITHQEIADKAYQLYLQDTRQSYWVKEMDNPIQYWSEAKDILQRLERE